MIKSNTWSKNLRQVSKLNSPGLCCCWWWWWCCCFCCWIAISCILIEVRSGIQISVDLHLSKALFSLDPDKLQLHCFLGLGALFCCSFFCPLDQPCKTLQTVQVSPQIWCLRKPPFVYTYVPFCMKIIFIIISRKRNTK